MAELSRSDGRQAFGASPLHYDKARPDYPARVYELLRERCGVGASTRAFEIGPGTGQASRPLLELGVASLVAIEPDQRLAGFLRDSLGSRAGARLQVRAESFEEALLPAGSFDLGVAATAYHWLEPGVRGRKIFQALAPGGWWAMWWTVFSDPFGRDEFFEATQGLFNGLDTTPSFKGGAALPFGLDVAARREELMTVGFETVEHETIRWGTVLDARQIAALYGTFSQVARLAAEEKARFMERLNGIVDRQFAGRVERRFVTPVYLARRP